MLIEIQVMMQNEHFMGDSTSIYITKIVKVFAKVKKTKLALMKIWMWSQILVRFALSLTVTEIAFLVKAAILIFFLP